jgi:hypothetical protein
MMGIPLQPETAGSKVCLHGSGCCCVSTGTVKVVTEIAQTNMHTRLLRFSRSSTNELLQYHPVRTSALQDQTPGVRITITVVYLSVFSTLSEEDHHGLSPEKLLKTQTFQVPGMTLQGQQPQLVPAHGECHAQVPPVIFGPQ